MDSTNPAEGIMMESLVNNTKKILIVFLSLTLLFSCGGDKNKQEAAEKDVAMAFFDAIYNQKNLKKAVELSSVSFQKELKKYKTANNLARRLLNLQFNSVKMTTAAQKTQIIDEYNTQVSMTVVFTGERNNGTFKDFKRIRLIKENNTWVVDKILKNS